MGQGHWRSRLSFVAPVCLLFFAAAVKRQSRAVYPNVCDI